MKRFDIRTDKDGFFDITQQVCLFVRESGIREGACLVYCPHTTAAITINENADPDVTRDVRFALAETFPERTEFRHFEGNSHAHLKSSVIGCSELVPIEHGEVALGTWQGIYFCEFDGPRNRSFFVQVLPGLA